MGTERRRCRIIQWATGNIGARALRATIEHPDLDLVGLWVSSPAKEGKNAGELAGIAPTGVIATTSAEALVVLEADCVLYMRQGTDIDEVCALLASGKNIVTTRADFHHPASMDGDVAPGSKPPATRGGRRSTAPARAGVQHRGAADRAAIAFAPARLPDD